jgi:hypothetical protein
LDCGVTQKWVGGLIDNHQVDVKLTSTADTGTQVNLLGTEYLEGFELEIKHLLRTRMELNCANAAPANRFGMFFARIKGKHYKTGDMIETKAMVYVVYEDPQSIRMFTRRIPKGWGVHGRCQCEVYRTSRLCRRLRW